MAEKSKIARNEDAFVDEALDALADDVLVLGERLLRTTTPLLRALTQGELVTLLFLDESPQNTSPVYIASQIGVTRPRVTQIVDALVEKGLARRVRAREDARKIAVVLTDEGKAAVEQHRSRVKALVKDLLEELGGDRGEALRDLLREGCALVAARDLSKTAEYLNQL